MNHRHPRPVGVLVATGARRWPGEKQREVVTTTAMEEVRPGMRVVDSLGRHLGTVDSVVPGRGSPVTTGGPSSLPTDLVRALSVARNAHPQTAARMMRGGYLRIRPTGVLTRYGYATADQVRGVDEDAVRLSVPLDHLVGG